MKGVSAAEKTALCLSGGGVRSAVFCLGVLQGLARLRLLTGFDYLSTVSGGGFTGSWLSALIRREGGIDRVAWTLASPQVEPPVSYLREHCNYLPSNMRLASGDLWSFLFRYFTKLLLNGITVLPVFVLLVLMIVYHGASRWGHFLPAVFGAAAMSYLHGRDRFRNQRLKGSAGLLAYYLLPVFLWAYTSAQVLPSLGLSLRLLARGVAGPDFVSPTDLLAVLYIPFAAACVVVVVSWNTLAAIYTLVGVMVGYIAELGALVYLSDAVTRANVPAVFFVAALIFAHLVNVNIMRITAGILHRMAICRWWQTAQLRLIAIAIIWPILAWLTLYAPDWVRSEGPLARWLLGVVLVVAVVTAVARIYSTALSKQPSGLSMIADGAVDLSALFVIACAVAGAAFLVGALQLDSIWKPILLISLPFAAGFLIDVNAIALYSFYKEALVRAFLGASNPQRRADPLTNVDPRDDIPLETLAQRPLPVICAARKLEGIAGDGLFRRTTESFVFTPFHCGSDSSGFRPTQEYAGGVTLGAAASVSGAAISPQLNKDVSIPVALFRAIFNDWLGVWLGNPAHSQTWTRGRPSHALQPLLSDFSGVFLESPYVYVSDGGHFDNLGLYEMVRRRCRHIVAVDASEDPTHTSDDLANAISKIRIDFGVIIEIESPAGTWLSGKSHYALARIRYTGGEDGTLLYIKPCLTGDEPVEVASYASQYPDFPHQSTSNQWFTEAQFESYRLLGLHTALSLSSGLGDIRSIGDLVRGLWETNSPRGTALS